MSVSPSAATTAASASAAPPAGLRGVASELVSTLRRAAVEVGSLVVDGPRTLVRVVRRPRTRPFAALVAATWMVAIVADAGTTWAMMSTGLFEEANPVAALGMGSVGMELYVVAASAWSVVLAGIAVGRPRGVFAGAAVVTMSLFGLYKAWTALDNALLWHQVMR